MFVLAALKVRRLGFVAAIFAAYTLAVPGMPLGFPGMEVNDRRQAYTVWLLQDGGSQSFTDYPARSLE